MVTYARFNLVAQGTNQAAAWLRRLFPEVDLKSP